MNSGNHAVEGTVEEMMTRRGDSRSVEEMCPEDVKDPVLMRLDEIGENYENLKTKVISYSSNTTPRDCRGKGEGKRRDEGKGYAKGKGKAGNGR